MAKSKAKKRNPIVRYIQETRAEVNKVNWPTGEETWRLTQIVLVVTVSMALFLGLMDYLFSKWLRGILASNPVAIGLAIAILALAGVGAIVLGRRQE